MLRAGPLSGWRRKHRVNSGV